VFRKFTKKVSVLRATIFKLKLSLVSAAASSEADQHRDNKVLSSFIFPSRQESTTRIRNGDSRLLGGVPFQRLAIGLSTDLSCSLRQHPASSQGSRSPSKLRQAPRNSLTKNRRTCCERDNRLATRIFILVGGLLSRLSRQPKVPA
jgi:hypothetical protein